MASNYFLTGCASGIGKQLTGALLERGDKVFACDLNQEALEAAAEEGKWPSDRVTLHAFDVRDFDAWEKAVGEAASALDGVDVLMNIAGVLQADWVGQTSREHIDLQVDVNVKGVMYGTHFAAEHMVPRGKGHIINIASYAGLVSAPGLAVYCGTKYAVRGYSVSAAYELRPKGVYVTAVCPATVQTPLLDNQVDNEAAELFFSGMHILSVKEIEHAILNKALVRKPYVLPIPYLKSHLARFADHHPEIGPMMAPIYQRSGRKRMEERRKAAGGS